MVTTAKRSPSTSQAGSAQKSLRVLLLSYEFTFRPFSGNGILARSLVKALLGLGCHVTVWCCRPHPNHASKDHHLCPPEVQAHQCSRLDVCGVMISAEKGWKRLDKESSWAEFHWSHLPEKDACWLAAAARAADIVCAIDWTGGLAWRSVPNVWENTVPRPPLVYLNFRVYSSGVCDTKLHEWYDSMECQVLRDAQSILALSENDKQSLEDLMDTCSEPLSARHGIDILRPPLRADMEQLAYLPCENIKQHLPPQLVSVTAGSAQQRCFLTCVVRLSPEKDSMRFVKFVESALDVMKECALVPVLAGAAADEVYAENVRSQLQRVSPHAVIIDSFLSPTALSAVFSQTALNFHPCAYDAYGMTIVEAAAFGAPSVVAGGGVIGATAIVNDGVFEVEMPRSADGLTSDMPQSSVKEIFSILRDRDRLVATGAFARKKALAWDEIAYGKKLLEHFHRAIAVSDQK